MGKYAELFFMYEVWRTRIEYGFLRVLFVLWIVLGVIIAIKDIVAKRRK